MNAAAILSPSFFARPVLEVARRLIGCTFLCDGVGGRIVETEAYAPADPASHGFRGKTKRNAVMFGPPGFLYVYFTYGMHFCANLVCEDEGAPAAVLLRALEPERGVEDMAARRGTAAPRRLCSGPARLCQALGIDREQNGLSVCEPPLVVLPREAAAAGGPSGRAWREPEVVGTPRVGISPADERPWRFVDAGSDFLSRPLHAAPRSDRQPARNNEAAR